MRKDMSVFVIWAIDWTTVIDLDCDSKFFKEVLVKGEGHSRISKYDEVVFTFSLHRNNRLIWQENPIELTKLED